MKPDCKGHELAIFEGRGTAEDADHCRDCRSLFTIERTLASIRSSPAAEPPESLVTSTLARLSSRIESQSSERKRIAWRLILVAAFSLPAILAINAILVVMVYRLLAQMLPNVAAMTATVFVAASLLMGVCFAYATLPLLASFGFRLRESF